MFLLNFWYKTEESSTFPIETSHTGQNILPVFLKIIYILSFYSMFCPDVIKEACNPDVKSDGKYVSH